MRHKHPEPTPEMEAALIAAWHTTATKAVIRSDLGISENYLEAMWTRLRKADKLPPQRRTGLRDPRPQNRPAEKPKSSVELDEASDKSIASRRRLASMELLRLLREHHGCLQDTCCGRMDVPPALLQYEADVAAGRIAKRSLI